MLRRLITSILMFVAYAHVALAFMTVSATADDDNGKAFFNSTSKLTEICEAARDRKNSQIHETFACIGFLAGVMHGQNLWLRESKYSICAGNWQAKNLIDVYLAHVHDLASTGAGQKELRTKEDTPTTIVLRAFMKAYPCKK